MAQQLVLSLQVLLRVVVTIETAMSHDIHIRRSLPTTDTMPLKISEDLDDDLLMSAGKRSRWNMKIAPRRCLSLNSPLNKSIMKWRTLDESLHSSSGAEDIIVQRRIKNNSLQFSNINIREYLRTVGDNPSCSSGPPVR